MLGYLILHLHLIIIIIPDLLHHLPLFLYILKQILSSNPLQEVLIGIIIICNRIGDGHFDEVSFFIRKAVDLLLKVSQVALWDIDKVDRSKFLVKFTFDLVCSIVLELPPLEKGSCCENVFSLHGVCFFESSLGFLPYLCVVSFIFLVPFYLVIDLKIFILHKFWVLLLRLGEEPLFGRCEEDYSKGFKCCAEEF